MARNKFDVDETLESPFSLQHLKRSFVYIKRYRGRMFAAFLLSFGGSVIGLFGPLITKEALDVAVPDKNVRYLLLLVFLLIGTIVINIAFHTVKGYIMAKVGQGIVYDIRKDLFAKLQRLPFSYYDNRPHGKILVRVVQYVNAVSDMLSNGLINLVIEVINIVFVVIFMLQVSPVLTLVILSGLPVFILFIFVIKPLQRKAWQAQSNKNSNYNAFLHESIDGIRVTQSFGRQSVNRSIMQRLMIACKDTWMRATYVSNTVWFCNDIVSFTVLNLVYIVGMLWMVPVISFGTILAMASYSTRFWQPIAAIANIYNQFINTIAYLERIFETMDDPEIVLDSPDAIALPALTGKVEFCHVDFGYEEGDLVLKDLSFTVKPGESIALVGPTGAGKTTVVNLISRFYNLNDGKILLDGNDISKVTLHSLRSQMGIMLQDSFIFSGTIYDNIRYGRLDATDAEIEQAARAVCAHDFIVQMEKGYQTEVNERGSRLSQGQKQLISFARTLLADPRILILDEATSSIDTQTERLLQIGLQRLLKGRTSFIIAHRLSTIKHCDRIMFVCDKGIKECGSHQELMDKKGLYYTLYTSQLDSFE